MSTASNGVPDSASATPPQRPPSESASAGAASPARRRGIPAALAWLATVAVGITAVAVSTPFFGFRADLLYRTLAERLVAPALLLAAFIAATFVLFFRRERAGVVLAVAAAAAIAAAVTRAGFAQLHLWANATCLWHGLLIGLQPLGGGLYLLHASARRSGDGAPRASLLGGALGATAGLAAMAALHRQCALRDDSHNLLFHAGAVLLLGAAGALLQTRLARR